MLGSAFGLRVGVWGLKTIDQGLRVGVWGVCTLKSLELLSDGNPTPENLNPKIQTDPPNPENPILNPWNQTLGNATLEETLLRRSLVRDPNQPESITGHACRVSGFVFRV